MTYCEAETVVARIREILRDPDLYDSYNSVVVRCLVRDIKEAMEIPLTGRHVPALVSAHETVIDAAHIERQRQFSVRTFGPGRRTEGVTDHITKELAEIRSTPDDLNEWVDVVILGLDGAWRTGAEPQEIIDAIVAKQAKNESRRWPDWRTVPNGSAIEHVRSDD